MVTMRDRRVGAVLVAALCLLAACRASDDEAKREHCGTGSACPEPPLDRRCIDQDGASVCADQYQFVVQVTGSGLLPDSSLTVISDGQSADYTVRSSGSLDPGAIHIPAVVDTAASLTFTGVSAHGTEVTGTITLSPVTPDTGAP